MSDDLSIKFDRIPAIGDADLARLARLIVPVARFGGNLCYLPEPRDWRTQSFLWDATPGRPARDLALVGTMITFHEFGAPSLFKPSVAEVLAQVLAQVPPGWLKRIGAFEVESDGLDCYHVLSDGYHFTKTVLYEELICEWDGERTATGAKLRRVVGRMTHDGPLFHAGIKEFTR